VRNIPSFQEAKAFIVNRPGAEEVIRQSLYDFQTYATAGFTSQRFFQVPQGQSSKTEQDTNLSLAGQLPQPQYHLSESIEIHFLPGVSPVTVVTGTDVAAAVTNFSNDVYSVLKAGSLTLRIGSKDFLEEAPLYRFPPKTKFEVEFGAALQIAQAMAADANTQIVGDYASACGRPYFLDPPLLIPPTQNFDVELRFASAVATPSGEDARIGVILDGLLYRLSQ
jgi:hypothetical protein